MSASQNQSNSGIETQNEGAVSKLNPTAELVRSTLANTTYRPESILYMPNQEFGGFSLLQLLNAYESIGLPEEANRDPKIMEIVKQENFGSKISGEIQKLSEGKTLSPQETTVATNFQNKWARRLSMS